MASVTDNAFLILRVLYENRPATGDEELTLGDLKRLVPVSADEVDEADKYLLKQGTMIDGTQGGDKGKRWLEWLGIQHVESEIRNRVVSTLDGERVLQYVIDNESEKPVYRDDICRELSLSVEQYEKMALELADRGLVEDAMPDLHGASFFAIRSTPEGREAERRGFKRETVAIEVAARPGTAAEEQAVGAATSLKVFLGWSGVASEGVARALHAWLPTVLPFVEPWVSTEDIDKGTLWGVELWGSMRGCGFGIPCLVPGSASSPWVLFEAGVLAGARAQEKVSPFLVGLKARDLPGPLQQFQCTEFDKEDVQRLVRQMNAVADSSVQMSREEVDKAFEQQWDYLKEELDKTEIASFHEETPADEEQRFSVRPDWDLMGMAVTKGRLGPETRNVWVLFEFKNTGFGPARQSRVVFHPGNGGEPFGLSWTPEDPKAVPAEGVLQVRFNVKKGEPLDGELVIESISRLNEQINCRFVVRTNDFERGMDNPYVERIGCEYHKQPRAPIPWVAVPHA